jgi:phosphoribosyl-ATP pyrophosphohydrolase
MSDSGIIEKIYAIAVERKSANPETSYVASLYTKGEDKILEKVGEEAIETILAHKSGVIDDIVYETADLWFHSIIALADKGIDVRKVFSELDHRFGKTGLRE